MLWVLKRTISVRCSSFEHLKFMGRKILTILGLQFLFFLSVFIRSMGAFKVKYGTLEKAPFLEKTNIISVPIYRKH